MLQRARALPLPDGLPSFAAVEAAKNALPEAFRLAVAPPYHIAVPRPAKTRDKGRIVYHKAREPLPSGSVSVIAPGVAVESPEMTFVRLAAKLEFPLLVGIGMELCGFYTPLPSAGKSLTKRGPLTSPRRLRAFVERAGGCHGAKAARRALPYIVPGSRSPKETQVALVFRLPPMLGGYGFRDFVLNRTIVLDGKTREATGRRAIECDLYWPAAHFAIEYDSGEFHEGERSNVRDSKKRAALAVAKETVHTLTYGQVNDSRSLQAVALLVARATGKRLAPWTAEFINRQVRLRGMLMDPRGILSDANALF